MTTQVDPTPLFAGLIDDAAVFPPGLAPLDVAVREHLDRRTSPYAAYIGPLLVPATAAGEVKTLADADLRTADEPLRVGLIVRPDSPLEPLREAVEHLRDDPRVEVSAVELGWTPGWQSVLGLEVPVVVEVGLAGAQQEALDDIAAAVDDGADVIAKFRTGQTPSWPWPNEADLAGFLDSVVLHGLPFKLTGGLHHAVRGTYRDEPMHGVLNVIVATHEALNGAEAPELAEVLAQDNAEVLVERVTRLTPEEVEQTRASLTAYGCCVVLEPIEELVALGLLTPTTDPTKEH
ncbi:MAG TPA: hypothetical protein VFT81_00295 [Dermatophilaceae bacterium]|nr:hypothetical protein [Dermatophilaceae bacterium]